MRIRLRILLSILALTAFAAGQTAAPSQAPRATTPPAAGSPQGTAPGTVSNPLPTPTPPRPGPMSIAPAPIPKGPENSGRPNPAGIAPTSVSGTLKYSPVQLDFGAIDYAASAKRTFSLTPPVAGEITLEFPAGSFVAAELRRVPPLMMGKPQAQLTKVPPMKPAPISSNNQAQTYKWSFAAGEEMQLDILFAPSFSKDKTPGLRTATMKFSGPGSITPWSAMIPMRGTVNGQVNVVPPPPGARAGIKAEPASGGAAASLGTLPLSVLTKKTSTKVRNPHLMVGHGTILSIIADQENAAKSIRASRGLQLPASKPMSAPGNSTGQVSNAPGPAVTSMPKPTPTPNTMGQASMAEVVPCVATTKIRLVDGKTKGVVFTPIIPGSNGTYQVPQHVIQGCYFGKQQGSAYLFGSFKKGQLPLTINYWSDSEIDAALDPNLQGELDEDNVTLVVKLADGTQLKATGFKFYAARGEPIPLQVIPSYAFKAKYGTAPTSFITPLPGSEPGAYLVREKSQVLPQSAHSCGGVNLSTLPRGSDAGVDYYDFSKLTKGFTTDSFTSTYWFGNENSCRSLLNMASSCDIGLAVSNSAPVLINVAWDGDNLQVGWQADVCRGLGWKHNQNGKMYLVYDAFSMSRYALTVYVVGPKGVRPWADELREVIPQ